MKINGQKINLVQETQRCIKCIKEKDEKLGTILEGHDFIAPPLGGELYLCKCSRCGMEVFFYIGSNVVDTDYIKVQSG